jgi:ribosomal protein S18 acetylase RimI-like enzyme
MSAIMDEKKEEEAPAETVVQGTTLPEDETIRMQWKELAKQYTDRPRLASMIANGKIDVREADGVKIVDFFVLNEAQKQWVEEKLLRELENKIREMLSCPWVNILVEVTPVEESAEKVPYMPEEKAKDLMEKNPDVRAFVADLGLDTK